MQKSITTQELKTHVGEVVDSVRLRGDRYVIKRRNKPVAAIVPIDVLEGYALKRQRLFALIREVQAQIPADSAERIDAAVADAVLAVRTENDRQSTSA